MKEIVLDHRYHLQEEIGVGGMAVVYRAWDERTNHDVAVKVLKEEYNQDEEFIKRFQREAEAASKVSHHNIVNLLDVGVDGKYRYLVMEYVHGKTLKQIIKENGKLNTEQTAQITLRILSALQHAHEQGIIHRDIKPQNILMYDDGRVKVSDFGIAHMANTSTLTKGDKVIGSVHYYSPEQAQGNPADVTSDLYSVGVTMYEMLTGRVPFDGDNPVAIAMQHIKSIPTPIENFSPDVPLAVIKVCMKAMEKNPRARYQSALEMARDLRLAVEGRVDEMDAGAEEPYSGRDIGIISSSIQPEDSGKRDARRKKAESHGPFGKRLKAKKPGRKTSRVTVVVSILVSAAVCALMVFGAINVFNKVVNSASVPDMVGTDIEQAKRLAERNELKTEILEINHPTIPEGTVILQAPEVNTALRKGDTVVLTVSKGPSSQIVPLVTGSTLKDAIAAAKNAGLTITVVERVISTEVQTDFVMSQTPEPGSECQPGDIIQVTVSGGAVTVPNLTGMTLAEAQNAAAGAKMEFSQQISYVDTDDAGLHGTVAEQSPQADSQVIIGTVISAKVWRNQNEMHMCRVKIDLPDSDGILSVKVGLTENGGTYEYTAFTGEFPSNSSRHPEVELSSMTAGSFSAVVYIGNERKYALPVVIE